MHGITPSRHPARTRPRRTSDEVRAGRSSRSPAPAPGVSCPLLCGPTRTVVIIGQAVEVMRRADHLCAYIFWGRAQGPTQVIHPRRLQRFRRVSFRPGGGPPLLGHFAAMPPPSVPLFVSPPWRLCSAFSFSGCNFTRLYFSFVLRFPVALRSVSVSLAWAYGVSRGPLWAVPVAVGLAYPAAGAPVWGFWWPSWAVRVQAWPEAVQACPAWAGRFLQGMP